MLKLLWTMLGISVFWGTLAGAEPNATAMKPSVGMHVSISGWVSNTGPMEFDQLMDGWSAEIEKKTLLSVNMDSHGVAGVWQIQAKRSDVLATKLTDAVRAQGLQLEIR